MTSDTLPRLSLLDLAFVRPDQQVSEALSDSLTLAQTADQLGRFERIWFAEHHNMAAVASAATSVLVAHIAANTEKIRLGAGGVMLPNHSPLVIAEQYGTLAELHPGRIDLGVGRAPGTDQATVRALRRDPRASDQFPQDVVELQGFLSHETPIPGVVATPGRGTQVPVYILGSSLFGAQLAAHLGLPYAFASHFAPDALLPAITAYKEQFQPSEQWPEPYLIAALNVVTADDGETAVKLSQDVFSGRVRALASLRGGPITDDQLDAALKSPLADQARHMLTYTATGDPATVRDYLVQFAAETGADELMLTNPAPSLEARVRTLELLAEM